MAKGDKNEPMDATIPEGEAIMHINEPRNAYALDQLIEEVTDLFPETSYEVGNRSPRSVAFSVQFVTSEDTGGLYDLLSLIESDDRVQEVVSDVTGVLVTIRPNPVLMDSRDPFDLEAAFDVMGDGS